jgi:site-specific DNA-methyltransferase (adenine-specific)
MIKLINGECLAEMDKLIQEGVKVDLILTDIPQEITQNTWDNIIPFKEMWDKLYKLRKNKNTPIILFTNQPFTTHLIMSNLKDFKVIKYWQKDRPSGFLNAKKMPSKDIEEIAIFYEKQPTYNPQFWEGEPLHGLGSKYKNKEAENNNYGDFNCSSEIRDERKGSTQKYPRQLMKYNRPHPPIHPTEKSVDLLMDIIKTYSNEGDLVLDFTAGSFSCGEACIKTNRNFIGIEKDEKYFKLGEERLKKYDKMG